DFLQDWTAWLYEIEVGLALLAGKLVIDISKAKNFQFSRLQRIERSDFGQAIFNFRKYKRQILLILVLLIIPFVVTNYVYGVLNKPKLIANTIPEGVQRLEKLAEIVGNERVFLSGSTVFWANALYDLNQVRGGVDKAAIHPYWDHAAFQLREGSDPELAQGWLEALGVSYVLVHGPASPEAYHDFRNIDKWSNVGEVVWENQGDVIYEVSNVSLAWVVDLKRIKSVKSPKNGTDLTSLNSYLAAKKRPVEAVWKGPGKILLDVKGLRQDEGVVLAVSFNSKWRVDANISLKKDPLGNILVIPEETKNTIIILQYK
ncbi:hypothetical protein IID22_05325, partial [Patescibacteria group bacterium]|nr:hypothetical protein [Patescibacteria group bacterium]